MRRFVVLFTFGAAFAALGATACGDGNNKPPLTPDSEHSIVELPDAEAPTTAEPAPENAPPK